MKYTIKSRKLGRDVTFSIPGNSYIYVDLNGKPGTLGQQICSWGRLSGSTLEYNGGVQEVFEGICQGWWRAYLKRCNALRK